MWIIFFYFVSYCGKSYLLCVDCIGIINLRGNTVHFILEVIKMDEKNLQDEEQEKKFKRMLRDEILIVFAATVIFLVILGLAVVINMNNVLRVVLITFDSIMIVSVAMYSLKLEQQAGYYECGKCHNRYVPTYSSVFLAMHYNRTRYMKCPECKKWSWQKKVLKK